MTILMMELILEDWRLRSDKVMLREVQIIVGFVDYGANNKVMNDKPHTYRHNRETYNLKSHLDLI